MLPQRKSPRHPFCDYSSPGRYFITICTKERRRFFGFLQNGKMVLSDAGIIAKQCRSEIEDHFPFIKSDEFVVMPDHVHGILRIKERADLHFKRVAADYKRMAHDAVRAAPPFGGADARRDGITAHPQGPKYGSLGYIVNQFKGSVTRIINKKVSEGGMKFYMGGLFAWQGRYHDHIVRDQQEYENMKRYIQNNPLRGYKKLH